VTADSAFGIPLARRFAVFAGRLDPVDTSHPVWAAAVALAASLGAVIRGDEGEIYDLQTGEIVDG